MFPLHVKPLNGCWLGCWGFPPRWALRRCLFTFQAGPQIPAGEVIGGTEHPLPNLSAPKTKIKANMVFCSIAEFTKSSLNTKVQFLRVAALTCQLPSFLLASLRWRMPAPCVRACSQCPFVVSLRATYILNRDSRTMPATFRNCDLDVPGVRQCPERLGNQVWNRLGREARPGGVGPSWQHRRKARCPARRADSDTELLGDPV